MFTIYRANVGTQPKRFVFTFNTFDKQKPNDATLTTGLPHENLFKFSCGSPATLLDFGRIAHNFGRIIECAIKEIGKLPTF